MLGTKSKAKKKKTQPRGEYPINFDINCFWQKAYTASEIWAVSVIALKLAISEQRLVYVNGGQIVELEPVCFSHFIGRETTDNSACGVASVYLLALVGVQLLTESKV